jgi:cytidyltransferase-like protein
MVRVFTPDDYNVFHAAHLNYLMAAAAAGDYLVVGVQEDSFLESQDDLELVNTQEERIAIIEEFRFVDEAVGYTSAFQGPLLEFLEIDVFACDEAYGQDECFPEQQGTLDYCKKNNIQITRIPHSPYVSSSRVRSQLKDFWNSRATKVTDQSASVTVLTSFGGDQDKISAEARREFKLVLDAVSEPENKSLLDIACGDGRLLVHLAKHFKHVVGIDYIGDLLALAQKRLAAENLEAELFEGDVTTFTYDGTFDAVVLSGILPCLDDEQCEQMLQQLELWAADQCTLVVRSSVGLKKRINVVNQYSSDLETHYTGYYRTVDETTQLFSNLGWRQLESQLMYQHRPDTAVWWFSFSRE